jgi:ribosomal protein S18 acetylase RimI-like enzyme
MLVAVDGPDVIGLAWVITTRALDRAAYLKLLLIAEGEQSRGVGTALLDDAERRAGELGSRHMVLLVTTTNRRARSFYKTHGYRYVGRLPGFVRPRIGESLYVKALPADPPRPRRR